VLGVNRERCEDREDGALDVARELLLVCRAEVGVLANPDALLRERGADLALDGLTELLALGEDLRAARVVLFARGPTVKRQLLHTVADLPLETADPLHEELVVEHAEDAGELHAFEQRQLTVLRELQHAARELQPAQLAVNERLRRLGCDGRLHI
jgi:hypothetical protein